MHWEDAPNLNRGTLDETTGYGWNQIYFKIKKSDVDKFWANKSAWIVMIPHDIPPEDIVAVSRNLTNENLMNSLWKYNKWDLFKQREERVEKYGYDTVKNKMADEYWYKEEREEFDKYLKNRK